MRLTESHDALVEAVAEVNSNVVVVLSNGSPIEMPWADRVKGILEAYLGGQAGGGAIADILTGRVNPSGKLAETFPLHAEDNPSYASFPGGPRTVEYRESVYVGYRYYDSAQRAVRFPFGHGLSYTTFQYDDLALSAARIGDDDGLTVEATVKNVGPVAGKETVQLYGHDTVAEAMPRRLELLAYKQVELAPGESVEVSFAITPDMLAQYGVDLDEGKRPRPDPYPIYLFIVRHAGEAEAALFAAEPQLQFVLTR